MDSLITAALTAVRVPDDYSEENSSSHVSLRKESGLPGAGTELRDFQGSSLYRQRARQNGSKQPNKAKSLKRRVFQWSSNLLQANPAGRLKEVHFMWGTQAQQEINPAGKVHRNTELNFKCQGHISKSKDRRAATVQVCSYIQRLIMSLIQFWWRCFSVPKVIMYLRLVNCSSTSKKSPTFLPSISQERERLMKCQRPTSQVSLNPATSF